MPISSTRKNLDISKVAGLQAALDAKSPINHTHAISLIEGLQAALDAKSPTNHTHAIALIEGLQTALNAKSSTNHTHTPEAWQILPLLSGWSAYSTTTPLPQCRKYLNFVEVKGTIKKASSMTANELILTLPIGYRPSDTKYFCTFNVNGYCRLQLDPDGTVKASITTANIVVGLDFIFGLG